MPPFLSLAIDCENWNALPMSGGILAQPPGLMAACRLSLDVWRVWQKDDKHRTPEERAFMARIAKWLKKKLA